MLKLTIAKMIGIWVFALVFVCTAYTLVNFILEK